MSDEQTVPMATGAEAGALPNVPAHAVDSFSLTVTGTSAIMMLGRVTPLLGAEGIGNLVSIPAAILTMSPHAMKELSIILSDAVAKFEAENGELRTPFTVERSSK